MPQNSLALERVLEQEGSHQPTPEDPKTAPNTKAGHPPLSNSRPSRTRKAPKEHWVVDANERKSTTRAAPPKKGSGKVFDPVFITSNSTSRLGKADVYVSRTLIEAVYYTLHTYTSQHMLLEDPAWTSLSSEQQSVLMSMLPPGTTNRTNLDRNGNEVDDTESMRPQAFTMSNDCFRTDVAKFKEDLKNGHLAKTWQAAAEQATIERAAGEYDGWKAQEAELWWGQRSKQSNR